MNSKFGNFAGEGSQNVSIDSPRIALIIQGPINQRVVDTLE
jgi:hypothetical protein